MPLPRKTYRNPRPLSKPPTTSPNTLVTTNVVDENGKVRPTSQAVLSKDVRTQHERQPLKTAANLVKVHGRRAQGTGTTGHSRSTTLRSTVSSKKGRQLCEKDEAEQVGDSKRLVLSDSWKEGLEIMPLVAEQAPRKFEVRLADLIQTRKPRKQGETDFEVIPHMRSVIVLDDHTPNEFNVDEPWEHVMLSDEETDPIRSYAQVAAPAK